MLHAYCQGMLNLDGDPLDPSWWRRVKLCCNVAARQLRVRMYEYKHELNVAVLSYDNSDSAFRLHREQAEALRNAITGELMPWVPTGPKSMKEAAISMREEYIRRFSDPRSEKGRAAIAKQLAAWKEQKRGYSWRKPSKRKHHR